MTLSELIKERTGMQMQEFTKRNGFSYNTFKKYSLPIKSKTSRQPSFKVVMKLSSILKVKPVEIVNACYRM